MISEIEFDRIEELRRYDETLLAGVVARIEPHLLPDHFESSGSCLMRRMPTDE